MNCQRDGLKINVKLCRRGLRDNLGCAIYSGFVENSFHVLRNCSMVKRV